MEAKLFLVLSTKRNFNSKCKLENLEGDIYRNIQKILEDKTNQEKYQGRIIPIQKFTEEIPVMLSICFLRSEVFNEKSDTKFNFCKLLAGSEGTLAVTTEIKLNLVPLPPANKALVCVHLR